LPIDAITTSALGKPYIKFIKEMQPILATAKKMTFRDKPVASTVR
jgi:hypothetical protein